MIAFSRDGILGQLFVQLPSSRDSVFGLITILYVLIWSVCTITFLTTQYVSEFFQGLNLPFWGSVQLSAIECQRSSFLHILVHMEGFVKPWEG
jgi:hypothetical protein